MTPPKIDKSHGFMQSIIKNQVLRDEYEKEQRQLANAKKSDELVSQNNGVLEPVEEKTKRNRTPRRAPKVELYVPPHLKKRVGEEQIPKTKESTEVTASPEVKQELKKVRKSQKDQESRVLFKFEYEDGEGEVKSLLVKEDDNAEDLAETFGKQLGLTKSLRKALQQRLQIEITSCHDS